MKIGIISNLYPPYIRGGAEIVAYTIAHGLKQQLQHVFVISTRPFKSFRSLSAREELLDEIQVYRFFPLNIYFQMSDFKFTVIARSVWHLLDIFNIHSYIQVRRVLKIERPSVIITHNLTGLGFLIPRLISSMGIRHVHTIHDVQLYNPSGIIMKGNEKSVRQRIFNTLGYPRLMKFMFAHTTLIISPSRFLIDFYRSKGFFQGISSIVLTNPVVIPEIPTAAITSTHLQILYLGQINKQKGVQLLIEAMRATPQAKIDLTLVGTGSELKRLVHLARTDSRIRFLGWLPHPAIMKLFRKSHVLVVPTMCYDNSPTVVFEA